MNVPRILIVEDENTQRKILSDFFTIQGFHVIPACNGKEAVELAKKEKAAETTEAIEKLIAGKKKEFEDRMKKLDLRRRTRGRR